MLPQRTLQSRPGPKVSNVRATPSSLPPPILPPTVRAITSRQNLILMLAWRKCFGVDILAFDRFAKLYGESVDFGGFHGGGDGGFDYLVIHVSMTLPP